MAALLALLGGLVRTRRCAAAARAVALARRGTPVEGLAGLVRLLAVPVWLLGHGWSCSLGYATQGAALDRGELVVVQPLLVTTIVWALPLGRWLRISRWSARQVLGAAVVVVGLAMFVLVGDPDAGVDSAKTRDLVIAAVIIGAIVAALLLWLRAKSAAALRAAVLGVCAGLLFGLSASFAKPVIEDLHVSVGDAAGAWQTWALLGFGFAGFVIQQLSLATGQLAPAMAAVSVANPAVSVILGILLFDERLTRPAWHVVVAVAALVAALAGAVLITLANRETPIPGVDTKPPEAPRAHPAPA